MRSLCRHFLNFDIQADDIANWASITQNAGVSLRNILDWQLEFLWA